MRVARSPALVGIGMSSKQLAPLSFQQALVTRRRLIQQRRFWPATPHFLVLAAVALSLLMLTSAELYLPTQKQIDMTIVIIYPSACAACGGFSYLLSLQRERQNGISWRIRRQSYFAAPDPYDSRRWPPPPMLTGLKS